MLCCRQYAPVRGSAAATASPAPTSPVPGASTPVPAHAGPLATTADLTPAAFTGVSESAHVDALRAFYAQNAPEKVAGVSTPVN